MPTTVPICPPQTRWTPCCAVKRHVRAKCSLPPIPRSPSPTHRRRSACQVRWPHVGRRGPAESSRLTGQYLGPARQLDSFYTGQRLQRIPRSKDLAALPALMAGPWVTGLLPAPSLCCDAARGAYRCHGAGHCPSPVITGSPFGSGTCVGLPGPPQAGRLPSAAKVLPSVPPPLALTPLNAAVPPP